jgi:LA2681-like HEPN
MTDSPEDVYNSLIARRNLAGLDDEEALWLIGTLTDLSGRLRRAEGLEKALRLVEELHLRKLTADRRAISHYFLGNVWANLRALSGEDRGEWEQPELEQELLQLRTALRDMTAPGLEPERVCQMLTNLGNAVSSVGRPVEAIRYWDDALQKLPHFSMARGNRGYNLFYYAAAVHERKHQDLMFKFAHADLQEALSPESRQYLHGNTHKTFEEARTKIKGYLTAEYLAEKATVDDTLLGDSEEEISYRRWCLEKRLFLSPLNDLGPHEFAADDALLLPPVVTYFGNGPTGPALQGMYNQLKQAFVSARYLYYEGTTSDTVHFSDKNVYLYDTVDVPVYSLAGEKTKYAFRIAYSTFDKIGFFLKHYFGLSVLEHKVSFMNVWYIQVKRREGLEPAVRDSLNWPLRGLFWLGKNLYEDDPEFRESLEPEAKELRDIRHALEHRYLKLSHERGVWL